jgi:hypothetical protein
MEARIETSQEQTEALMDVSLETTEACLERIEVNQGKAETKMEVETIGAVEDRSEDQRPAVVSRNPLKRWTKDDVVLRTPEGRMFKK